MDELANTEYLGAPETGDRVKFSRILSTFAMYGAVFEKVDELSGLTAIHLAAECNNLKMIEWLLKQRVHVDVRSTHRSLDMNGSTPLMFAAKSGRVEALGHLIRRGIFRLCIRNASSTRGFMNTLCG